MVLNLDCPAPMAESESADAKPSLTSSAALARFDASTIPEKAICDDLIHGYLRTFESMYQIIHVPTFWKEYERS